MLLNQFRTLGEIHSMKVQKFGDLAAEYFFSPLASETLGGTGPSTRDLLTTVRQRLQEATGCRRAGEFLL